MYMPCPDCLDHDGSQEIHKKHLAVNASKYLELGKWRGTRSQIDLDATSALCMKKSTKFRVSQLLGMQPLALRMPDLEITGAGVISPEMRDATWLVDDGHGNIVPEGPGMVTPLSELPADHPAMEYLIERKLDLRRLADKFSCAFCHRETPEDPVAGRKYGRLPGGFKRTPQGRVIFYAYVAGVRVAWQGRVLEKVHDSVRYFWHPYFERWEPVYYKEGDTWVLRADYTNSKYFKWDPAKYITSPGAHRNDVIMGLDHALSCSEGRRRKVVFLCEGPLDAAKFDEGVCAMGKYLSESQASMLATRFQTVVVVPDNDKAGLEMLASARKSLHGKCQVTVLNIPEYFHDAGELPQSLADELAEPFKRQQR